MVNKKELQEGCWEYEYYLHSGKNVYFFRDPNHTSPETQDELIKEIRTCVEKDRFKVLYVEGYQVTYQGSKIEESTKGLEKDLVKELLDMNHSFGLKVRWREDPNLIEDYLCFAKDLYNFYDEKREIDALTPQMLKEYFSLKSRKNEINYKREMHIAQTIKGEMVKENLGSVGLLFGEGHYPSFRGKLIEPWLGVCSFLVRCSESDFDKSLNYLEFLSQCKVTF